MKGYDTAIIGGGIVGLATAKALLERRGKSLVVLEAEDRLAAHQSGHNSGVIHSGLYYRAGSLKARLCVQGRSAMYRFCEERGVPVRRCGKLIVATHQRELARLDELATRGQSNGLQGLRQLSSGALREHEPHCRGIAALLVPDAGVVDFARVTQALGKVVQEQGGEVLVGSKVVGVHRRSDRVVIQTTQGDLECKLLINCAGLQSDRVARMCGLRPDCRIIPFRGQYYELIERRRELVRTMIYPVPDRRLPFLGVHLTGLIDGRVEIGPSAVLAWDRHGYRRRSFRGRDALAMMTYGGAWRMAARHWRIGLSELRRSISKRAFTQAAQRLVPDLAPTDLVRGKAGIRAQAVDASGRLLDDFRVQRAERMIHVLNAPSPAATAALSIGEHLAAMAQAS